MNSKQSIQVLLISSNTDLRSRLGATLKQSEDYEVQLLNAASPEEAMQTLYKKSSDLVYFDLTMGSGMNFGSFGPFVMQVSFCPVIAIVDDRQKEQGKDALSYGAADWLATNSISTEYVERSISYCQQLFQLKEALRGMALLDPSTGVYNLTGFHAVTWPQIQMASRTKKSFLIFSIDLKGLDNIEQKLGSHERHNAVICAARVLTRAFRRSDVVAKIDNNSFAAFAGEAAASSAGTIQNRIRSEYKQMHESEKWPFDFDLSVGYVQPDLTQEFELEPLITKARTLAS